jgi:acyl carrier protein
MDIERSVRDYIVENFLLGDDAGLDSSQSLLRTGIVDSTGIMELVMFLEERYQIEVIDAEMLPENLDTIDNIVRFVQRKSVERLQAAPVISG